MASYRITITTYVDDAKDVCDAAKKGSEQIQKESNDDVVIIDVLDIKNLTDHAVRKIRYTHNNTIVFEELQTKLDLK